MREPAFWWRPRSWSSRALAPVAAVYGQVAARRLSKPGADCGVPVICVGNYHVGGAGKTPTVVALIRFLTEAGQRPFVLSRGYGGSLKGPVRVDPARHSASDVGDEPLLLARAAPTIISPDRVAGANLARDDGASVIVMDDGLQNPSLTKHLALVVIDASRGIGNGKVFPAGPLRAPLPPQIARTDALVMVGEGSAADNIAGRMAALAKPVFRARLVPDSASVQSLHGQRLLAFAGIGDPEKFFQTLRAAGLEVGATRGFADHHRYRAAEIAALRADARQQNLTLVTTEKDLARLGAAAAAGIATVPVTMTFDDEATLRELLQAPFGSTFGKCRSSTASGVA